MSIAHESLIEITGKQGFMEFILIGSAAEKRKFVVSVEKQT